MTMVMMERKTMKLEVVMVWIEEFWLDFCFEKLRMWSVGIRGLLGLISMDVGYRRVTCQANIS